MDSRQRKQFNKFALGVMQNPEKVQLLRTLLLSGETIKKEQEPKAETTLQKVGAFWSSTSAWAVIGMIVAAVISQLSLKFLLFMAWAVFFGEFMRVGFFKKRSSKVLGNAIAGVVFVAMFYVVWIVIPKPKEQATVDQQLSAFAERFPWLAYAPEQPAPAPIPIQHTTVDWLDAKDAQPLLAFNKNEKTRVDVGIRNWGEYKILSSTMHARVVVASIRQDQSTLFKEQLPSLKKEKPVAEGGVILPHDPHYSYISVYGPELTDSDVSDLTSVPGKKMLCGIGLVDWSDSSGKYQTYGNQCFYRQPDGSYNWHVGTENNSEIKLK